MEDRRKRKAAATAEGCQFVAASVNGKRSATINDIIATRTLQIMDVVISLAFLVFRKHSLDHMMT